MSDPRLAERSAKGFQLTGLSAVPTIAGPIGFGTGSILPLAVQLPKI